MYGGEYAAVQVENGGVYTFSTCGGGSWDTQLSLYTSTGTYLAYNDDFCGLQSEITWTSTFTGSVHVVLDRYYCSSQFNCMNLTVTRAAVNQSNPCSNKIIAQCGSNSSYSLSSGTGVWNPPGPWGTPGNEQVFEFTPTITGVHIINMTNSNFGWVDLFIQANSCGVTGWTYVDDIYSTGTNYITLNAGTTYYFLVDDENTSASNGTFSITCPNPATDPCNNVTAMACGSSETFNLSGTGSWNPGGPYGTPGEEAVFSFTPTITSDYDIITTNSGYYVDLFYKSSACGSTAWTYVDDIYSSATNTLFLTAGITYYFLIDDENISSSSGSISIECPCVGNQIDNSFTLSGNQILSGNTIGACDDCGLRPSEDITYEVVIPCSGTYTFETCNLASWDTYLYLSTSPCSGVLASNDDNCGLRSSISYSFASGGTYYITVEGWSTNSGGAFDLNVSKSCNMSVSLSSPDKGCGNNLTCHDSNDGEVSSSVSGECGNVSYSWSNGLTSSNIASLDEGTYSLIAEDQWGCTAAASIDLIAPPAISVDAGNGQTVYYGYTPLSCADLQGSASGGCGTLNYEWFENNSSISSNSYVNVCPSTTTTYTIEVTDVNGCQNDDQVDICVVDVVCYAGNSNVQKVEICHVPPGNPGNAHTICVNENAVQSHLDNGCQLGACGEALQACNVTSSSNSSGSSVSSTVTGAISSDVTMEVYPNPFDNVINASFNGLEGAYYQIDLVDVTGKVVAELFSGSSENMNSTIRFNGRELAPGIYLIKMTINGEFITQERIIKQ
jgi:hypothetical protein